MTSFVEDIRFAARTLRKSPGFAAVAITTLALGIGANTAIFSVVNGVLLRPLPYRNPGRLVQIWTRQNKPGRERMVLSYPDFRDWRSQATSFDGMAAYSDWTLNLTGGGEPERIASSIVSASLFDVLGVRAERGRTFLPSEDTKGRDQVAVISDGLWKRRFGGDPAIVNREITLDGAPFTIVGVVATKMDLFEMNPKTEIWVPVSRGFALDQREGHYLDVVGRLKAGVPAARAKAELGRIAAGLAKLYPESNFGFGADVLSLQEQLVGSVSHALILILSAVGLVLLIAIANIANMLLARSSGRLKEVAVRTALGAPRRRLLRQFLTESLLLALIGGTVGVLLAQGGISLLLRLANGSLPRPQDVRLDLGVLGFTLAASLAAGILFGLAPALHTSGLDLNNPLKESGRDMAGGRRGRRIRELLVISEVMLSLVLLAGAAVLIRSFGRLRSVDPGFHSDHVVTFQVDLPKSRYTRAAPVIDFHDRLLARLKALPGIASVGTVDNLPFDTNRPANLSFVVDGHPRDPANVTIAVANSASAGVLTTLGIPLIEGRTFDARDTRNSTPVVVINKTLAEQIFPGQNPIGRRISLADDPKPNEWSSIIGVVGDARMDLASKAPMELYLPFDQSASRGMAVAVRTRETAASLTPMLRRAVAEIDPAQPIYDIRAMQDVVDQSVGDTRFRTTILGVFALLALFLAAVGIYGVMSYSMSQRTRELGIRLALGARPGDLAAAVMRPGLVMTATGIAAGLVAALGLSRILEGILFGISARDPMTLAAVALLLGGIALAACIVPALRARRIDPIVALRAE